jgi:CRISPR-associated protein Csd1
MQAQCLITGQQAPIARLHPKIKGVKNALPGGATIAGFNAPSYWSYGLTQSFNAPVSDEAAHRYATALSTLLDGPRRDKHRLDVGHTTVAFWTDRPTPIEDIFLVFAAEGSGAVAGSVAQDENVRAKLGAFLAALRRGRENYGEIDHAAETTGYCILGLAAPTQARIAVRFFHHGTLAELLDNLRRHHGDIGIERRFRDTAKRPEPEFPSVRFLLDETCPLKKGRPDRDKIPPLLEATLLQAIVTGGRYPEGLFGAVMRRIAADRIINYARACTIKGYLVRNLGRKAPMTLDLARAEPAYRLGRLFAALDKTQQDALGKVNATIRDRFYASASATPGAVFPRLLRTYQHHLAKLESGQKVNREKLVQEILAPVADIPGHLNLAEQGLFALGYYQQMNAFYTKKENRTDKAGT